MLFVFGLTLYAVGSCISIILESLLLSSDSIVTDESVTTSINTNIDSTNEVLTQNGVVVNLRLVQC